MGARWRTTTGTGRAGIRIAVAGAATTTLFTLWIRTRKQSMRRRRVRKLESARAARSQLAPRESENRDLASIVYHCVHRNLLVRSRPFKAVKKLQLCARRARDSTHGKHKERQSPILR